MKLFDNAKKITLINGYEDFTKDDTLETTLMCICLRLAMKKLNDDAGIDNVSKMSIETYFANLNINLVKAYYFLNDELAK